MQIDVLGVGEAFDPHLANSSILVSRDGFELLVDCGPTIPPQVWRRFDDPDRIDAVAFTHLHPDHCLGFAALVNQWESSGRRAPLAVYATPEGRPRLEGLVAFALWPGPAEPPFPIAWHDLRATDRIGPFALATAKTRHSVENHALSLEAGGARLFYSGDGGPTAKSRELMRGADVAFHECYFRTAPEGSPGTHCDLDTCLRLADELGLADLRLYHVRHEERAQVADAVAGMPQVRMASAGDRIVLGG